MLHADYGVCACELGRRRPPSYPQGYAQPERTARGVTFSRARGVFAMAPPLAFSGRARQGRTPPPTLPRMNLPRPSVQVWGAGLGSSWRIRTPTSRSSQSALEAPRAAGPAGHVAADAAARACRSPRVPKRGRTSPGPPSRRAQTPGYCCHVPRFRRAAR